MPPLQSVTSIKYYDTDDVEYTLAATDYTVDADSFVGRVFLRYGKTWPSITLRPYIGVAVEYVAGYGDTAASVPRAVRHAILLTLGHWYKQRENSTEKALYEIPDGAKSLLWKNRVVPA